VALNGITKEKIMETPIGNKIAAAFVKAQKAFGPALKTSQTRIFGLSTQTYLIALRPL
jgi:hypothetical protein